MIAVSDARGDPESVDIVVVGCGYVGIELGRRLRTAGSDVAGVRRSDDGLVAVSEAGIRPVRADVTDPESLSTLPDAEAVVFAASSGGRGAAAAREVYVDGLAATIDEYGGRESPPNRLVYTSSTGVYGDHGGAWVDETTPLEPESDRQAVLVEAERIARERAADRSIDGTVARFAGLYGPGRYRLERYLDGPVTEGYLNMVHRDDAAGAVAFLLNEGTARDRVVTVVDDEPVDRRTFAEWLASQCDVDPPETRTVEERLAAEDLSESRRRRIRADKRCSNDRLRELGYEFDYPTFREGYREAVASYPD